ncbi:MAG: metal ABC transporter permease [Phycisphaerales bacterium]|jgi:manganese/zinc/iron transport system permease protein|nr:metal ABC transporter permease [Phycisphaerales bacterium]
MQWGLTMTLDYDGWIILIGVLVAACCAIPGSWLVVRGMGMMGDAVSHAVLPGIAIGFLVSGTRSGAWMFLGAAIAGILAAVITQVVHHWGRIERGAAMGLVFTTFFSLGLLLIVQSADSVDLDPNCVLYGAIELAPLDTISISGMDVPRMLIPLAAVLIANVALTGMLFKELLAAAFDPGLATSQGFDSRWLHYGLMALTAATCVACFEAVGSIITVALLVAPPAAALLFIRRMKWVIVLAALLGGLAAVMGHLAALTVPGWILGGNVDTSSSGMMAVASMAIFLAAAMFAPGRGSLARRWAARRDAMRVAVEDALGLLFRLEERAVTMDRDEVEGLLRSDVRIGGRLAAVLARLRRGSLAELRGGNWKLTVSGRSEAQSLVRAHRLWETYLAGRASIPSSHLHAAAERLEHVTDPSLAAQLQREVGDTPDDPHGRPIPPA